MEIFGKIMNADGVVLGAPNYINSVPGPMKALFDRFADAIHCQMLTGKFGCSVCTAGGTSDDEVLKYMNGVLINLGVTVVGSIVVVIGRDPSELENYIVPAQNLGKS
jgi:multimeric flavodoxin WrbA